MKTDNKKLPSLSVIMPCLNEQDNVLNAIENTILAFEKYSIDGEIILVDDGSTDNTGQYVKKYNEQNKSTKVISHKIPLGVGASFWDGVKNASNDFVVFVPGDNENDARDFLRYFHLVNDVDIIIPFVMNIEVRSKFRRIVSSIYRLIINITFGMNLNYTNGNVIYNRKILSDIQLKTTGFFFQAELLIKLIRMGYFYAEAPHILSKRQLGKTKAITLSSLFNVIFSYCHLVWDIHFMRVEGRQRKTVNPNSVSNKRYNFD